MTDQSEFQKWLAANTEDSGRKIAGSALFCQIVTDNALKNPLCALQLGFAIMMDKPIVLIADKDMKMPAALAKIAKVIERVDIGNPADMARAGQSLQEFAKTLKPN